MKIVMNFAAAGLATAAILTVTACTPTGSPSTATTTASPSVSASAEPTPTSTPLTPAELDLESAKTAVVKFWKVLDRLGADPESRINDMDLVARDTALEKARADLLSMRVAGYRIQGTRRVEEATAKASGTSKWTVTACVDTSKMRIVNAKGKTVSRPPYRILRRSTVIRDSRNFFVTTDKAIESC